METYEDYLQHWGILGMHWGERNGPPYPLSRGQMNSSEKKKANLEARAARLKEKEEVTDAKIAYKSEKLNALRKKQELKSINKEIKNVGKNYKQAEIIENENAKKEVAKAKYDRVSMENAAKKLEDDRTKNSGKYKSIRKMTNQELSEALSRSRDEKALRENDASSISNGSKFVKAMLGVGGTVAVTAMIKKIASKWGDAAGESLFGKTTFGKAEKAKKEAKEAEEKAEKKTKEAREAKEKSEYTKAVESAKNTAIYNMGINWAAEQKKGIKAYNEAQAQVQTFVNNTLQNQGYEKYYKKDK